MWKNNLAKLVIAFMVLETALFAHQSDALPPHPKTGTVVFVHGFLRTSRNMSALAASFKREHFNTLNWGYPSRQKTIEEHAKELVITLREIAKEHPNKPISFVTHSMGGLVVRVALNLEECPIEAKMGRAVLIAPPNQGSVFARALSKFVLIKKALGTKAGAELMQTPLGGFAKLGNFPDTMPILVISGTAGLNPLIAGVNDGKVSVKETLLNQEHAHETVFAGHSWICHTPTVIKKAKHFLSIMDIQNY